jgi:acyl carrier protein
MTDEVDREIRRVLGTVFGRPVGADELLSSKTEPSWDSLRHVEVLLAVEGALDVRFDEEEMAELDSVDKLVRSVKRHRAA